MAIPTQIQTSRTSMIYKLTLTKRKYPRLEGSVASMMNDLKQR